MSTTIHTRATTTIESPDLLRFALDYQAAVTEYFGPHSVQVATSTSEESLTALGTGGLTTVTFLQVSSNQDISITLGTANVNVPVSLVAGGILVLAGTSLTAISISNSSGSTANVRYLVGGS